VVLAVTGACSVDLATSVNTSPQTYCATTTGLVHHYAWPWTDSTVSWNEVSLVNSPPLGAGYCLTFHYRSETAGTFEGGGSFGAWFDVWDIGRVDTVPLWYLRDDVATGQFAIQRGMMWLTFDRGGAFLADRPYLHHTPPTGTGFSTAGTTRVRDGSGYLFLSLRWHRPAWPVAAPDPGDVGGASAATGRSR
jgi:hypothetical protein